MRRLAMGSIEEPEQDEDTKEIFSQDVKTTKR